MATSFQRALEQTDLTDVELAFRIGVTVTTIWRWRTGRSVPVSAAIREAIAAALGRSVAELFAT